MMTTLTPEKMNIIISKDIKRHKYNDLKEKFKSK